MKRKTFTSITLIISVFGLMISQALFAQTEKKSVLYTPFTKVSVAPGKTVSYSIDVINNDDVEINESIYVSGIPRSWKHSLKSGAYEIEKLAVLPGEKKTVTLKVDVPYQVKKGNYTFYVKEGSKATLPLTIKVSTGGSGDTELTCDQKNMEGTSKSKFRFSAVLKNQTAADQQYALMAKAPRGWNVEIKPQNKQATSTEVKANSSKNISYEIQASKTAKAGTYKIPVKAVSGSTSAEIVLEVVITGSYEMNFTTPTGLLSTHITAGDNKEISLAVKNTGSAALKDVKISSSNPKKWEVTFEPNKIDNIKPGESQMVKATIKADKKAIPGDYVVKFSAKSPEQKDSMSFRVQVKTPMLMGWLGILIILLAIGGVLFLFKKYGRR